LSMEAHGRPRRSLAAPSVRAGGAWILSSSAAAPPRGLREQPALSHHAPGNLLPRGVLLTGIRTHHALHSEALTRPPWTACPCALPWLELLRSAGPHRRIEAPSSLGSRSPRSPAALAVRAGRALWPPASIGPGCFLSGRMTGTGSDGIDDGL
jgi:hypothetical protein